MPSSQERFVYGLKIGFHPGAEDTGEWNENVKNKKMALHLYNLWINSLLVVAVGVVIVVLVKKE